MSKGLVIILADGVYLQLGLRVIRIHRKRGRYHGFI